MNFLNIDVSPKNKPAYDEGFLPLGLFFTNYEKNATKPLCVAVERSGGQTMVYDTKIYATKEMEEADAYYVDRLVKFLLWSAGGFKVSICGDDNVAKKIKEAYCTGGAREFDKITMERIYEKEFVVQSLPYEQKPEPKNEAKAIGRNTDGCRIGFDAGGSDRKVSAVVNGESIYSEEVVWHPKTNSNPDYHYNGIVDALKTAASKMERVDAIGISSAGDFVDNKCMIASLFLQVSEEDFNAKVKDIYIRAAKEIGDVPIVVANDGDVTALAGSMGLDDGGVLGIAMGTSEAAGYVDIDGNITGCLNELAFAPVDCSPSAMQDEWSGDIGCGVKYFSQDGAIKLAEAAGIKLMGQSPAEKLKEVQELMEKDDERAVKIYESIGTYLAHTLKLYSMFYEIKHVLMLGRVTSGKGGDILLNTATRVMKEEYPELKFVPKAPDEKTRRVGQSVAAASLPKI